MKNAIGRVCAAAVMIVSALVAVPPGAGAYESCRGWVQTPVTVGVGGRPFLSSPTVEVYVCSDNEVHNLGGNLPAADVDTYSWGGSTIPAGAAVKLWVPDGLEVTSARVGYSVDGQAQEVFVPIGFDQPGEQWVCLFYTGLATYNPGGCQLYVEA